MTKRSEGQGRLLTDENCSDIASIFAPSAIRIEAALAVLERTAGLTSTPPPHSTLSDRLRRVGCDSLADLVEGFEIEEVAAIVRARTRHPPEPTGRP
jgi:hypothetical protein